tara:strand:- start:7152 stop:7346 length:195 start_codon:yes stop_codon:yes gene_type:complete
MKATPWILLIAAACSLTGFTIALTGNIDWLAALFVGTGAGLTLGTGLAIRLIDDKYRRLLGIKK